LIALISIEGACGHEQSSVNQTRQNATVEGSTDFIGAVVGDNHGCVIRGDGRIYCWGSNSNGQLGRGMTGATGFGDGTAGAVVDLQ
jgi:alpha-tubulin suppressor-like RCC1 family protein